MKQAAVLGAAVDSGESVRVCECGGVCVCARLEFKGLFACVDMFVPSQLGGNHCVSGILTRARLYSELDYVPGSVLMLTITKSFCFRRKCEEKPCAPASTAPRTRQY